MAVPKRKTSRSRRDKRRAQHGISVPRLQVCPNCKTYKGRDVEPLRIEAP
jgi:large subunit ribosomal protein L32